MRTTVAILGIPVDDLDTAGAVERIDEFVQTPRFHQVATANTDFLLKAQSDPELKTILRTADLVVPDGMPLVWASRLLHTRLAERVAGADLVPLLAARAAARGWRIYMLGGEESAAQDARRKLEARNPGLQIVGCESPDVPNLVTTDHAPIVRRIQEARPDILLVAFGNPKQEKWIHMHRRVLNVPACIGVGGTFDFLSGKTKRAPKLVQKLGLEFAHRWRTNPERLGARYRGNLVHFPPLIWQQIRLMRRGDRGPAPRITDTRADDCTVIAIKGPLGLRGLREFQERASRALDAETHCVVDMRAATHMDSAVLGTLLNLTKRASWVGCEVRLVGPNSRLRRALSIADAEMLFQSYASIEDARRGRAAAAFEVCVTREPALTVTLCGCADVEQAGRVAEVLGGLPAGQPVALDLRQVTYADCAMLSVLHRFADNRTSAGEAPLVLAGEALRQAAAREGVANVLGG